jgi:two-component system, LytTR family, response regulator
MTNLSAVIVDDERRGRELLQQLLGTYCPEVLVKYTASSVDEATNAVNEHQPDILFLDMRIGNEHGFDVLPGLKPPLPFIIVITAHEEYAIKALRAGATDYLLKPIISDELKSAVRKVLEKKMTSSNVGASRNETSFAEKKIAISTVEGLLFIKAPDIIRCEASGAYTEIYMKDGTKIVTSTNLGEFERLLPESWGFLRIHHSSIINLAEITMYVKADGGSVVMSDKSTVMISQRKKGVFLEAVRRYSKI